MTVLDVKANADTVTDLYLPALDSHIDKLDVMRAAHSEHGCDAELKHKLELSD